MELNNIETLLSIDNYSLSRNLIHYKNKKARGSEALLDKMADNDHIQMDNIEIKGVPFALRPVVFEIQGY